MDGKEEDWLLMFKNETHNHPTEIEPFGGASTCIGGAIRDPAFRPQLCLSGHAHHWRGDITKEISETMEQQAAAEPHLQGRGCRLFLLCNQIGLATTYVKEIYDEGYVAKRMEVGAVVGAAPKANVKRERPCPRRHRRIDRRRDRT